MMRVTGIHLGRVTTQGLELSNNIRGKAFHQGTAKGGGRTKRSPTHEIMLWCYRKSLATKQSVYMCPVSACMKQFISKKKGWLRKHMGDAHPGMEFEEDVLFCPHLVQHRGRG